VFNFFLAYCLQNELLIASEEEEAAARSSAHACLLDLRYVL